MGDSPSPKYALALLGGFELTGPVGVVDLTGGKLAGLLAYLACTAPRPQSREKLATLLWGSHFDAQAKQNLRQALTRLRRVLGQDAVQGDGEVVWLDASSVDCDVVRFEALVSDGSREALNAAADLYRGRLVDDMAVREEAFDDWLAGERGRLLELALGALVRLGEQELAAGQGEAALKAGRRAVALDGLREDAHRLVMQALAATGRKAEALKHYQDFAALLKRELDAEPDAATRSLLDALRSPQPPPAATPAVARKPVAAPEVPAAGSAPELRQLTIMACTMVNTAVFSALLDPEDMRDLIATFHKAAGDVVARFDGFIAQYLSDGVRVYFGYPAAREHDTEQAVRAGLALCETIGGLKISSGATLQARVGIATGTVVVGDQPVAGAPGQRVAIGETPDLAARLQAAAAPGSVVIAAGTHRLVGRLFDCRALVGSSGEAWQVMGEGAEVSRFEARRPGVLSPFVGRQDEIELLLRRWEQAKSGEGRVVLLSGEPGIGKSRIAESLRARLEGEATARQRYFCSPHHANSALHPFIGELQRAAGFAPGSDVAARLDRLEVLLKPASKNLARAASLLAKLLGMPVGEGYPPLAMSPQQKRDAILAALLDRLGGLAAQGPLLIVFEDIHWIDPTSLDLLDRMVARAASLPVLLVITFRPELEPTWIGQPHVTTLPLSRLGRRDSASIIDGIAREKVLPAAVVERVLAQADGVPLFIEELTTTLLEGGLLRETADSYVLAGPLSPLAVPPTLQASLTARLDRLGLAKDVAVIGAALGREFAHELIAAVSALPDADLDAALDRLVGSGLVLRRGLPPDATYSFKHALVQDAAYATMVKNRRQQLHAAIAKTLIERFAAQVESSPEVAARHFTEAGLAHEAIGYWISAGRLAQRRWANREAIEFFEQALQLLETLPASREKLEQAIDLRFDVKMSLGQVGEFDRILDYLREAEGPAKALGDQQRLGQLAVHFSHSLALAGDMKGAIVAGENAEAIGEALGDVALEVGGSLYTGAACLWMGDYPRAEENFQRVLRRVKDDLSRMRFGLPGIPAVMARYYSIWFLADQGRFPEGVVFGQDALGLAGKLDDPYNFAHVCWYLAYLHATKGELDKAVDLLEHGLAVAREGNQTYVAVLLTGSLGHVYALMGRVDEGIALLERGLAALESMGHRSGQPNFLVYLGEACLLADRLDDALRFLRRGRALAQQSGQRAREARAIRLLADVTAALGSAGEAQNHYGKALALAEEIGMRPLIAHCHLGLGRLHHRLGARQRAARHVTTATTLYRELDMPFWLERAESEGNPPTRPRVAARRVSQPPVVGEAAKPPAPAAVTPAVEKPSIAVLPFRDLSGDPEREYFADGVTEDIVTALSRFRELTVIACGSSFAFKGKGLTLRQIADQLAVQYVLSGTLRLVGDRIRVSAEVTDAGSDVQVWSDRYDRALVDVLDLQGDISRSVAAVVEPAVRNAEIQRARRKPLASLSGYDLYLRALPHLWAGTRDGVTRATELLRQSLQLDATRSPTLAALAWGLVMAAPLGANALPETRREALDLARRAVELDGTDAFAEAVYGFTLFGPIGEDDQGRTHAEAAVTLNPSSAFAWGVLGMMGSMGGDYERAIECLKRSLALSPYDNMLHMWLTGLTSACFALARYEEGIAWARRSIRHNPGNGTGHRMLAANLAAAGRLDEALGVTARRDAVQKTTIRELRAMRFFKQEDVLERYLSAQRVAGIAE